MEWLNYHHLYYFWLVVKEKSFSKAAQKLRIAQSAVSLQVAKLEDQLGEKLIERGPHQFKLTEAGYIAFTQAEEIFKQGQDLVDYFKSGKMRSILRVGALNALSKNLQFKILKKILKNKEIEIQIDVGDKYSLIEKLNQYDLDVVLSDTLIETKTNDLLYQIEIANEPVCLVGSQNLRKNQQNVTNSLHRNGVYLPTKNSPITNALIEHFKKQKFTPFIRGYIDDIAFLRLLALESDALVALPKIGVQRELDTQELFILQEYKQIKQSYFLIYRQKHKIHPLINQLIHFR